MRLQEMQNKRTKKNSSMLSKSPKSDSFKKFPFLIRPVPQWYINNCVKQGILHMQPDCRLASSMQRLRLCTRAMHFQKHLRRLLPGLQRPWRVVHPKEKPRRTFLVQLCMVAIRAGDATPDEIVPKPECRGRRCSHAVDLGLYFFVSFDITTEGSQCFCVIENLEKKMAHQTRSRLIKEKMIVVAHRRLDLRLAARVWSKELK